ncbi:MAG: GerW family sporulation protein [Candidatus Rifleibacteriota bacterium]
MFKRRILLLMILGMVFTAFPSCYAEEDADKMMAASTLVGLSKLFSDNFSSSESLGRPVSAGEYVIIPVVCKVAGFGFGAKSEDKENEKGTSKTNKKDEKEEQRFGLGSGFMLKPVALIIIKQGGNFEIVKLNPGFFGQLAKHMSLAMTNTIKDSLQKLIKMKTMKMKKMKKKKKKKMKKMMEKMQKKKKKKMQCQTGECKKN